MSIRSEPFYNDERRENIRRIRRKNGIPQIDRKNLREEYHRYFEVRRHRLTVVATTRTPSGQIIDWVPIESQCGSDGKLATPPSESVPLELGSGKRRVKPVCFELEFPKAERGPEGTVPIPRRDLRRLWFGRRLEDHLSKHGRRAYDMFIDERDSVQVPGDGTAHEYGYSSQWVTCYGAEGNLAAFDPYGKFVLFP